MPYGLPAYRFVPSEAREFAARRNADSRRTSMSRSSPNSRAASVGSDAGFRPENKKTQSALKALKAVLSHITHRI